MESNFSPIDFIKLGQITYKYSGKIFNKVFNFSNDKIFGIWVARYLIYIQNTLYRVSKIKKFIKKENCLLVKLKFNSDKKLCYKWFFLFLYATISNCKIIEMNIILMILIT